MIRFLCWLLFGVDIAPDPPDRGCPDCKKNNREVDWYLPYHSDDRYEIPDQMTIQEKVHELYRFFQSNLKSCDDRDDIFRDGFLWMLQEAYGRSEKEQSEYAADMGRPHPCVYYLSYNRNEEPTEIQAERDWMNYQADPSNWEEKPAEFVPYRVWLYEKRQREKSETEQEREVREITEELQQTLDQLGSLVEPLGWHHCIHLPGVFVALAEHKAVQRDLLAETAEGLAAEFYSDAAVFVVSADGHFVGVAGKEFKHDLLELLQDHGHHRGIRAGGNLRKVQGRVAVHLSFEERKRKFRKFADDVSAAVEVDFDAPPIYTPVVGGLITDTRFGGSVKQVRDIEDKGVWVWADHIKKNPDWPTILWVPNYAIAPPPDSPTS